MQPSTESMGLDSVMWTCGNCIKAVHTQLHAHCMSYSLLLIATSLWWIVCRVWTQIKCSCPVVYGSSVSSVGHKAVVVYTVSAVVQ